MPKRKNLNGLPHNLTKSYFGTLRYYGSGYMADWLLNGARNLRVDTVTLDILNSTIDPSEMEKLPLMYHLKDLKKILEKELKLSGFETNFIVDAKIKVEIPDSNIYSKTLYCYPKLIDIEGRHYETGRLVESAYEQNFDPFEQRTLLTSLFAKAK
jgi:hypothetical protein